MSIYVDELFPVYFGPLQKYGRVCHMLADSEKELDEFAKKIGLPLRFKHGDHYDLTSPRRAKAIEHGAIQVNARQICAVRRCNRKQ